MHYLVHSITKLCQGRKQWYEGWEGIPMYDFLGKEGVLFLSVGISMYAREWMCLDCLRFGEKIGSCDCDKVIGDLVHHAKGADLCNSCVWKQRRAASPMQRVGFYNYILACSLNLKQTLENANNQVGKHNSLKS